MRLIDLRCQCGHEERDAFVADYPPCPLCGAIMTRRYGFRAAQDDSFIGGKTFENLADQPVTFHSKTDYRRYLKTHNLEECVRHVPVPGSDKSPHTTSWAGMDAQTLANAAALVSRVTARQQPQTYVERLELSETEEAATMPVALKTMLEAACS